MVKYKYEKGVGANDGKKDNQERNQIEVVSLEDLVPKNHLVRKLDAAMDFNFIYDLVKDLYKPFGRESIDPVVLVKIVFMQYIFGIPSMRKTIEEIEVNFAYRWFWVMAFMKLFPISQPSAKTIQEDSKTAICLNRYLKEF